MKNERKKINHLHESLRMHVKCNTNELASNGLISEISQFSCEIEENA